MKNYTKIIDESRLGITHLLLLFWMFVILAFDGYDMVIFGITVPALSEEWGLSSIKVGSIGSYTMIGTVIGAVLFGILSDKFGRKKIIIFTTFIFSFFTMLSGFATNYIIFTIFRIIAGLGLGGVMPNVIALTTEYSPKKYRTALVSFVFCGYSVGALSAALISRYILPTVGWQQIYWLAGILILLLPLITSQVPESISFLIKKEKTSLANEILFKLNKKVSVTENYWEQEIQEEEKKFLVLKLFDENKGISTILFWISCFSAFVLMQSMITWLPSLMIEVGYDLNSSLLFTAIMQIGAIMGTLIFGPLVYKYGFKLVIVPLFFSGAIALSIIGFSRNILIGFVLIFIIGAATVGVQNISNAFVSQYYSTSIRSTALGTTMAFGRLGGIIAPILIGILLTINTRSEYNFIVISIFAIIGGLSILLVQEKYGSYNRTQKKAG